MALSLYHIYIKQKRCVCVCVRLHFVNAWFDCIAFNRSPVTYLCWIYGQRHDYGDPNNVLLSFEGWGCFTECWILIQHCTWCCTHVNSVYARCMMSWKLCSLYSRYKLLCAHCQDIDIRISWYTPEILACWYNSILQYLWIMIHKPLFVKQPNWN